MGRALGVDAYLSRMVRDPGGSGRMHHEVGIRCRKCSREDWASAPTPGWGRRLFKTKGWDCGNGLSRHTCPDCVAGKTRLAATHRAKAREAELRAEPATVHHLPEPERPIVHVHNPEREEVSMTAIAAAMNTAAKRENRPGTRGRPFGFSTDGNAAQAARRVLSAQGVIRPTRDMHFRVHRSSDGTWSYEILTSKGEGPLVGGKVQPRMKVVEGYRVSRRTHAEGAAHRALDRMGIATPMEGVHYEISGSPGEGYVYRILPAAHPPEPAVDAAPSRLCGGGHLSRFDARKDALTVLQAARKTGGAPVENADYWVTQDGFNLWGWTATNPKPENQEQAAAKPLEEKVGEVVTSITQEPRQPTRTDNRRIMEALDEHYDAEGQRYRASFSDGALAQRLDLPRAWITRVREEFYGPETNEADAEARRQKMALLDAGVETATKALSKASAMLDTMAELETLVAELKALRAGLE